LARSTGSSHEILIDTNIIFSAILYPKGNPRAVFASCESAGHHIILLDYILDEIREIFRRKGLDYDVITDFFETYTNVVFEELGDINDDEASLARRCVSDPKDRPIFVFMKRKIDRGLDCYMVTGDKGLLTPIISRELKGRVFTAAEIMKSGKL
jgi:predicted nucleic acid-binding protein